MTEPTESTEVAACRELPRYIHAPLASVTITPFPYQPSTYWIGSWAVNDHTGGNIWHDAEGWHVSVNLVDHVGHAMLAPLDPADTALPTTVRLEPAP